MKKIICFFLLTFFYTSAFSQLGVKYDPAIQQTKEFQYFKPKGNLFAGDCIPFSKDGTYYCYWLLDSAHHASLKGLGGHQWALSTTTDLKNWKNYPLALGIDEEWEKSICTGSVVFYKNNYYIFYATRLIDKDGKVNEQLSYAISTDGIHYQKQKPNPFYTSAPGYSKRNFRDPKVFINEKTGEFNLFVSTWKENPVLAHAGGCLAHLTSTDLKNWTVKEPVLTGESSVPECSDYFNWNGWYYLIYSNNLETHYLKSRQPYGPWEEPSSQALFEWGNAVAKTAAFKNGRRISTAWIPSRSNGKDDGGKIFGGNMVFRELTQDKDGTLYTKFPAEMIPETTGELPLTILPGELATLVNLSSVTLTAPNGVGSAYLKNIPKKCRLTLEIEPQGTNEEYGLYLRSDDKADIGYRLNFKPFDRTVSLAGSTITAVNEIEKIIKLDIILNDDIIDVSINDKRCMVNRTPEEKGDVLWFYAKHGIVKFKSIKINALTESN